MWTRKELKSKAKAILKVSYWKAFLVSLILAFVGGNAKGSSFSFNSGSDNNNSQDFSNPGNFSGDIPGNLPGGLEGFGNDVLPYLPIIILVVLFGIFLAFAFRIFLGYPLEVGGRRYFVKSTQNAFDLNNLGFAFEKGKYFDIIKAMLWRGFLNFLWYLLLIIPGIVKSYAYMMVPYILADNPNIGYERALELSVKMTDGQKFDIFVLDLSFLGWYILGTLAFLIGTLFVMPYENATKAELYLVLRQNAIDRGICTYDELNLNPVL